MKRIVIITTQLFLIVCITAFFHSCASQRSIDKHITKWDKKSKRKIHYISNAAGRRGTIVIYNDSGVKIISEPPPDVALTLSTKLFNDINYKGLHDSTKLEVAQGIVELGKRTATVNILRDALYKLAEIKMNNNLDNTTVELFREILATVENISKAELVKASTDSTKTALVVQENNIKNNAELDVLLQKIISSIGSIESNTAESKYLSGFYYLIEGKINESKENFKEANEIIPQYANAHELMKFLSKTYTGTTKEMYQEIMKKYSWRMPKEVRDYMEFYIQVK